MHNPTPQRQGAFLRSLTACKMFGSRVIRNLNEMYVSFSKGACLNMEVFLRRLRPSAIVFTCHEFGYAR